MATMKLLTEVTGSVWKIHLKPGDAVAAGDVVMVIESMKMEIPVIAEESGTLRELAVDEGEAVSEGQTVATLTT